MKKLNLENCDVAVGILFICGVALEIFLLIHGAPSMKCRLGPMTLLFGKCRRGGGVQYNCRVVALF
jgi:hypothetical protein